MPIPVETFYKPETVKRIFAVSSVLLVAAMLYFVLVDYDRHWRHYQKDYMSAQAGLAHLDFLMTQTAAEKKKLEDAKAAIDAEVARLAQPTEAQRIQFLENDIAKVELEAMDVKLTHGQKDAVLQVTRSRFEEILAAHGPEGPETVKARKSLDADVAEVERLRVAREEAEDRLADLNAALRELREPLRGAQKRYDDLVKASEDAVKKDRMLRGLLPKKGLLGDIPLLSMVVNAPFLDGFAPKGTPSAPALRQVVLPDVRQRLNYLESYTTDRCITCHAAIDNKDFSEEKLAAKLESALPAIDEQLVSMGREPIGLPDPPVLEGETAIQLEKGKVADHWADLSPDQRTTYFLDLKERANHYFDEAGYRPLEFAEPLRAHPDLDLYVNVDSPHPVAKMGCTVCHEGNPQETEFVLASHTPANHEQEEEWAHKHYVKTLGVPNFTFHTVNHYWDRPMLLSKYAEGSCTKCHENAASISRFEGEMVGRKINLGSYLYVNAGCANCHLVEGYGDARRVGPDLTRVASKLQPGFTEKWIYNPREFRPSTWMPHFFMQENNGPHSENEFDPTPELRSEVEVQAITKYLFALSSDWSPEPIPEGLAGDAEKGRALLTEVGCLACHANVAEYGEKWITDNMQQRQDKTSAQAKADYDAMDYNQRVQYVWDHLPSDRDTVFDPEAVRFDPTQGENPVFTRFGPELSALGSKVDVNWLYAWIRNPHEYSSTTKMPSLRLTEQEALDIATYLASLKHDRFDGTPYPIDSERSAMVDKLVFDLLAAQRSDARSRAIMNDDGGELTRMLLGGLQVPANADESRKQRAKEAQDKIAKMSLPEKRMAFLGSKMITHYGCYSCHLITGFEEASRPGTELTTWAEKPVTQLDFAFFGDAFDHLREEKPEIFGHIYPPEREDLVRLAHGDKEGNPKQEVTHTHAAFAYHKLRNPRIWDREKIKAPYDKLKMPNFYFNEEEAEALVTFLMGRKPARVTDKLTPDYGDSPVGRIAEGRDLTRELNCIGCHQIENNAAVVHQYYRVKQAGKLKFDEENAPPNLRGEGAKVQHSWLYGFFNNVETLRPWLKVRMPSFHLTNDQATTLVEYFAGLSGDEADELEKRLNEAHKFIADAERKAASSAEAGTNSAGESPDGSGLGAGDLWFKEDRLARHARYLRDYGVENRLVTAFEILGERSDQELASAYKRIFSAGRFLEGLYNVPYPFVDAPRPLVSEERFQAGEQFLYELKCLKCHALGDPSVPGANKRPTAPNLNLAFRRLRQDWFAHWLKQPAWIQPGTKMPSLWPDGPHDKESVFRDYGDKRAGLEGLYGATAEEQINLLLDFVYNAGLKNFTGVQPGGVGEPEGAATGDEEFTEEEPEEFIEE